MLGRLEAQATVSEVHGRLDTAVADMAREWPDTHARRGALFRSLDQGNAEVRGLRTGAAVAMGIIGLVLLLACFNVANLLLARAVERERELGVRSALGARPWQLARLVLIEGLVVALPAGMTALTVASWTRTLVRSFAIPIDQPQFLDLSPDLRVAAFVAGLVALTAVLPGIAPAISAARLDVLHVLGSHTGGVGAVRPARGRRALVTLQLGGSTVFLVLAGLFVQSYWHVAEAGLGFDRERLLVVEVDASAAGKDTSAARQYVERLASRVRSLPGVQAVALADRAPFYIGFARRSVIWPAQGRCQPEECPAYPTYGVSSGYFAALGIPLVEGRTFDANDAEDAIVITQALATRQWPDGSAVGRTLRLGETGVPARVVGVSANTHARGLGRPEPAVFTQLAGEELSRALTLLVRADVPPSSLVIATRAVSRDVDPDVPVAVKTMAARAAVLLWPFRTVGIIFTICGGLALVLALVGFGGMVRHSASRRMREFGVRVSMGATRRDLVGDVLGGAAALLAPGLALGLVAAFGLAHVARAMIVGVDVLHPATYVAVAVLQAIVGIVSCLGPALAAARTDPLDALRAD